MLKQPLFRGSQRALRLLVVAIIVAAVSACGFHLRGNIPLSDSVKNMHVVAPEGSFKDTLEEMLSNAGAQLASSSGAADVVLNISEATFQLVKDDFNCSHRGKIHAKGKGELEMYFVM